MTIVIVAILCVLSFALGFIAGSIAELHKYKKELKRLQDSDKELRTEWNAFHEEMGRIMGLNKRESTND